MGSVGGWRVCIGQLGGGSKEGRDELRSEIQRTISRLGGKVVGTVMFDRNPRILSMPAEGRVWLVGEWYWYHNTKRSQTF
jgi:hypothetical protein